MGHDAPVTCELLGAMELMATQAQFFEDNPHRTMQSWNAMVAEHERKDAAGEEER